MKLHLLVSKLYIYQNVRCNDKKKQLSVALITCNLHSTSSNVVAEQNYVKTR